MSTSPPNGKAQITECSEKQKIRAESTFQHSKRSTTRPRAERSEYSEGRKATLSLAQLRVEKHKANQRRSDTESREHRAEQWRAESKSMAEQISRGKQSRAPQTKTWKLDNRILIA